MLRVQANAPDLRLGRPRAAAFTQRVWAAASLLAIAGCAQSHGATRVDEGGAPDGSSPIDAAATDGEDPSVDEPQTADAAGVLDAAAEDSSRLGPDGGVTAVPSTGQLPPLPSVGTTMRAVRVDSAKVAVIVPPLMACTSVPNDASLAVDIQVTHQRCETLGPIEVDHSDPHAVTLIVWLWRSSPGCGGEEVISHHALKLALSWPPGAYTFTQSPGSIGGALTITRPSGTCSPTSDGRCTRTCDCAKGEVCVYDQGWDSGCIATCQPACDSVYGCAGGGTAECREDGSCAPGLACKDGRCRWALSLGQDTRHACARHADCGASLRCVEGEDGQLGCEVPCNTANMACPGLHYCARDASYSSARWVCEWGGE